MNFDQYQSKFDKEQELSRQKLMKKKKNDKILQQVYDEKSQEIHARNLFMKEEIKRKEDLQRELEEKELRLTGGIDCRLQLKPYEIEGEDDKVILSSDVLNKLADQDAFRYGPFCFSISKTGCDNIATHCGVREFTCEPGFVGLPKKVIKSLNINMFEDVELMNMKYVILPKVNYIKFRPKENKFFNIIQVKLCLEENLKYHTTISLNDIITVWYKGESYEMSVVHMLPEDKGTLVDTDVEVDLDHSAEFSNPSNNISSINNNNNDINNINNIPNRNINKTIASESTTPEVISTVLFHNIVDDNNILEYPEPTDGPDCILFKFKLPHSTLFRRFNKSDTIDYMFAVLSKLINVEKCKIQLSAQYPKRTIANDNNMETISASGFQNKQEMLHVIIL